MVSVDQQLTVLSEIGICINVTTDDLIAFEMRDDLTLEPYSRLVEELACASGRSFTPRCNQLWMCDYETIEDRGDYKIVIERLELMTDHALGLSEINDCIDAEKEVAWIEFIHRGKKIHWDAEFDNDWLDPFIIVQYDGLLREFGSPVRIYLNDTDYGQCALFAAFTTEQKARFDEICNIPLIPIEEQA